RRPQAPSRQSVRNTFGGEDHPSDRPFRCTTDQRLTEKDVNATTAGGYSYEPVPTVSGRPPSPAHLLTRSQNLLRATLGLFGQLGLATDIGPRVFAKYPVHAERAEY